MWLLVCNEAHIRKSKISPFVTTSLQQDIGEYGDGDKVDDILEGIYEVGADILERHDAEVIQAFLSL